MTQKKFDKAGWIIIDRKKSNLGMQTVGEICYNDKGKIIGHTGYIYVHFRKKGANSDMEYFKTHYPSAEIIKVKVTEWKGR